jgi:TonB family protein
MKSLSILILILMIGVVGSVAQDAPKRISAGVLNGKAVSLPQPEYPAAAKEAGSHGTVAVNVVIDENGQVISAVAEIDDQHEVSDANGVKQAPLPLDPALREAAESAALKARFAPVLLSGQPVQVKGRILYNFVIDKSDKPARVGKIYGPLLNRQAIELPQPAYPAAARAVKVEGEVTVHVTIDPDGNVIAAEATSGHPLLRAAAVEAARKAIFKPSLLAGQPTRNEGVVQYTFSLTERKADN